MLRYKNKFIEYSNIFYTYIFIIIFLIVYLYYINKNLNIKLIFIAK